MMRRFLSSLVVLCAFVCAVTSAFAQGTVGSLSGRVVDSRTGEPISKASVSVGESKEHLVTGEDGRFVLAVPAGEVELHVFTVGYGLLKRKVVVSATAGAEIEIRLGQEALRDAQQVTVTAGPFDAVVEGAASQYTLNNSELQDLSTILANDPFRAVASLPGASANQDFYADFAVRGAGLSHVGVYVDGVLIDSPSYVLEDSGDIGSLSVVNGDVVRDVAMLSGAFPPMYGNRTGAVLQVETREGARDRVVTRMIADALGVAVTSEGPIGKAKKATWLVSGRQSYLAYLLERLGYSGSLTLNYSDASGKVVYEVTPHHRFGAYGMFGFTSASRSPINVANQSANFFTEGRAQRGMSYAEWIWTPGPRTSARSVGSWTHAHEHDTNPKDADVLNTAMNVYGVRSDVTSQVARGNTVTAGFDMRGLHQDRHSYTLWNYPARTLGTTPRALDTYTATALQTGAYLSDAVTMFTNRLTLRAGGRWAHGDVTGEDVWLPHANAAMKVGRHTTLSAGYAQFAQMPSLQQMYGAFGRSGLRSERATHEVAAVDHFFNDKLRLHAELYNRQEHDDLFASETEFRLLPNGAVGFPAPGPTLANRVKAYTRGFEIQLQRRSANRLSGWVAYSRSHSRYWQPGTSLSVDGDFDQRNLFSAYGAYRITRTIDVSANARYGTGAPIPGFLAPPLVAPTGATVVFQLAQQRNAVRADDYFRADARVNKVFVRKHFNLTLHGEIENITGATNYAYHQFVYPANVATSRQAIAKREKTVPFLPVAGLTLEF